MTLALECIASNGAKGRGGVTDAHVNRISRVAKVPSARVWSSLMTTNVIAWWSGKTQTSGGQSVREGLEGDGWETKCQAEKGTDDTTERVTGKPDICIRVEGCDVVIELLHCRVIVALLPQVLDKTC